MLATDTLLPLGTQPVPGDAPAGASIRYDEVFTRLEAEMAKLENPAGGEVDWKTAVFDATAILRDRSKDLLVAAYLARGLMQQHGAEGLTAGLMVIEGMATTFWDGLQPQRPRARRSCLEWISERAAVLLDPTSLRPHDLAHVPAALARVEAIWTLLNDRFEGEDCGMASLRRRLRELSEGAGTAAAASTEPGAAASPGAGAASSGGGGGAVHIAGGPATSRVAAIQRLAEVADYYRRYEPHSPVGYLVNKAMSWSDKSFEQIFQEMLKNKREAQDHIWDLLGIPLPEQQ